MKASFLSSAACSAAVMALFTVLKPSTAFPQYANNIPNSRVVEFQDKTVIGLGHPFNARTDQGNPNPFGVDVRTAFPDESEDLSNLWATVCDFDSDEDGSTNGVELCDPECTWEPGDADPVCDEGVQLRHPGFDDGEEIEEAGIGFLVAAHGVLMILAWVVCAPIGILGATIFKKAGPPPTWFLLHRALLTGASVLTLLAFLLMVINVGGIRLAAQHTKFGIVVVLLSVLQPLSGFFRAHNPPAGEHKSSERIMWEFQHQWTGRLIVVLAVAALITGIADGFGGDAADAAGYILALALGVAGTGSFIFVLGVREPKARAAAAAAGETKDGQLATPALNEDKDIESPTLELEEKRPVEFEEKQAKKTMEKVDEIDYGTPVATETSILDAVIVENVQKSAAPMEENVQKPTTEEQTTKEEEEKEEDQEADQKEESDAEDETEDKKGKEDQGDNDDEEDGTPPAKIKDVRDFTSFQV